MTTNGHPSVSVIIPTYNRWATLCRAIDSVLGQTHAADELLIIDDGSTDETADLLEQKYTDQIHFYKQSNSGVSAARNTGINKATGDWIALLDSDDEWLPNKLQLQLETIQANKDCVLCHTDEIWIRNDVRVNAMNKHRKAGGEIFEHCLPMCAISPSSVVLKRTLLDEVGLFNESLPACEDYDLWLRICAQHKVHYLDTQLLIKYGGHEDQLSRQHWGMDRFRIQALQDLLKSDNLSDHKRDQTVNILERKTNILLKGAIKHSNESLIQECQKVLAKHGLSAC